MIKHARKHHVVVEFALANLAMNDRDDRQKPGCNLLVVRVQQ
jgi:hypothetical protein